MPARQIVVLGPPGSGKGTQARRLASRLGVEHLSVGALLRDEIERGSALGRWIADQVEAGELIPDDDVVDVLTTPLHRASDRGGWILDGAPRTLEQARLLAPLVGHALVIALEVPDDEVRSRLLARAGNEDRTDDTPEVIDHRIAGWSEEGPPVLEWYRQRGTLVVVDGTGSVDDIAERIADTVR